MKYIILSVLYFYICLSIGAIISAKIKGIKINNNIAFLIFAIPYIVVILNIQIVKELIDIYKKNTNKEYSILKTIKLFLRLLVLFYPFVYNIIYINVLDYQEKRVDIVTKKRTKETIKKTYPKYKKRVLLDSVCMLN